MITVFNHSRIENLSWSIYRCLMMEVSGSLHYHHKKLSSLFVYCLLTVFYRHGWSYSSQDECRIPGGVGITSLGTLIPLQSLSWETIDPMHLYHKSVPIYHSLLTGIFLLPKSENVLPHSRKYQKGLKLQSHHENLKTHLHWPIARKCPPPPHSSHT